MPDVPLTLLPLDVGWLLFWQSLILILLEGTSSDINTYLRQARTVCVDVDSQGRKVGVFVAGCLAVFAVPSVMWGGRV